MDAPLVSDPAFCLHHAEEIRALAEITEDETARDRLRRIANGYEAMAVRAQVRRATGPLREAAD